MCLTPFLFACFKPVNFFIKGKDTQLTNLYVNVSILIS